MSIMDFGARDEWRDTNYGFETFEEKPRRQEEERVQRQIREEERMLSGEIDLDENVLLNRIEHFIYDTNSCYYALCAYAISARPAWMRVIRKNTTHLTALIAAYTKWRQHQHDLIGEPGTDARRDVTYDPGILG